MALGLDSGGGPCCVAVFLFVVSCEGMSSRAMQQGPCMHGLSNVTVSTSDLLSVREIVAYPIACHSPAAFFYYHPHVCVLVQAFVYVCVCVCVCVCHSVCVHCVFTCHGVYRKKEIEVCSPHEPFLEPSGCRTRQPGRTWLLGPGACSGTNQKGPFCSRYWYKSNKRGCADIYIHVHVFFVRIKRTSIYQNLTLLKETVFRSHWQLQQETSCD